MQNKKLILLSALLVVGFPVGHATAADAKPAVPSKYEIHPVLPSIVATDTILTAMPNPLPQKVTDLIVIDRKVGTGRMAVKAAGTKSITAIQYTAWVYDPKAPDGHGVQFATTRDTNRPYLLLLGEGKVIRGLENGISGMRVGGKRTLIIPSKQGYGGESVAGGKVPSNADLIFDVELVDPK